MYIVTGGAGFIGSVVVRHMNNMGIDGIVVVDNLASTEKWRNLVKCRYVDYMHRSRFRDLLVRNALPFTLDAVVHLGACSATTERDADFLMENNFHYTRDVCTATLEQGGRFITASSTATYGDGSQGFSDHEEGIPALRPLNMYGYTKQLFDLWLLREHCQREVASLKFFNVYGPNEYHKGDMRSVALRAFGQIGETGRLKLFKSDVPGLADGEQKRDFVYVKDCAVLVGWLLEKPSVGGIRNVGTGQARTFNDLGRAVFAAMGREPAIDYIPMPPELIGKYQSYTCADMDWLAKTACPVRFRSLEEGVTDYIQQYLATADQYV